MINKSILLLLSALLFTSKLLAFDVKEIDIPSAAMNKSFKATVVTPDSYTKQSDKSYPVVYVLHGWSGNYQAWHKNTHIAQLADLYNLILVMPDGNYDSWYIDSPVKADSKFETYISKEVVSHIDNQYRTIKEKHGRAITGLSMGGFGALNIAVNNSGTYIAAGSLSGGINPMNFPNNWGLKKVFGDPIDHSSYWLIKSIDYNAHQFIFSGINLYIDCGVDDFFINDNRKLHQTLLDLKIPHEYIERPGGHTWDYWDNAIKYQILFFHYTFTTKANKA